MTAGELGVRLAQLVGKHRIPLFLISIIVIVWRVCWENKLCLSVVLSLVICQTEPRVVLYVEDIVIQNLPMQVQNGLSNAQFLRFSSDSRIGGVLRASHFMVSFG